MNDVVQHDNLPRFFRSITWLIISLKSAGFKCENKGRTRKGCGYEGTGLDFVAAGSMSVEAIAKTDYACGIRKEAENGYAFNWIFIQKYCKIIS
jgi:hypothetical protein